jgi:hypothetical protein
MDGNDIYQYKLNLSLQRVEYEALIINGDQKFERRNDGRGQIFTAQFNDKMNFLLSPLLKGMLFNIHSWKH